MRWSALTQTTAQNKNMITVISGTNRKQSECLRFANVYYELLRKHAPEETIELLALEDIGEDWFHADMYTKPAPGLVECQDRYVLPAQKLVFVTPEYNGSFPGIVKLFIDACSVREYSRNFKGKKAALLGVASGRAGNLRGMDHLTGVLNYLGTIVMPNKLPISNIGKLKNGQGELADQATLGVMEQHAKEFLAF